jgi:predicted kinase
VHIVESKEEVTRKDKFKRKVMRQELEQLAATVGGKLFIYTRDQPVEPILHEVIAYSRPERGINEKDISTVI